ncbi:MAG TPA: HEAT repeat domain-containing protein [Gemmatimonadaceae bacterium]
MFTIFEAQVEPLLAAGFVITVSLWLVLSVWVVIDRLRYDRRQRQLGLIRRSLADPKLIELSLGERGALVRELLDRVPTHVIYRMTGDDELAGWVREECARMSLAVIGLPQMLRDATPHRGARAKWRRISALHVLLHARPTAIHALLRVALADPDADVASAAATVLQRIGDQRAAQILIDGLRISRLPASRIAARLERFTIPLADLLRPLLTDERPESRYWAVTLLREHHDENGLAAAIMPLVDDEDAPVRKAALLTLGAMLPLGVARVATLRLSDPAPFVRSAAMRALAQAGERSPDRARRKAIASSICPLLADREWSVRATAKDALVRLGPGTWREVAAELSSSDGFARNGAAEVLQNLGVLDWTLRGIASGAHPTDEAVDVLRRALREGGVAMSKAAALRSKDEPIQGVDELLRTLQLEGAAS